MTKHLEIFYQRDKKETRLSFVIEKMDIREFVTFNEHIINYPDIGDNINTPIYLRVNYKFMYDNEEERQYILDNKLVKEIKR